MTSLSSTTDGSDQSILELDVDEFQPVAEVARYRAPRATINPDQSLGWVRRVWPIVMTYKLLLFSSIGLGVVSIAINVTIPLVTARAIDNALIDRTAPLLRFVVLLVILGIARGLLSYGYRFGLYKMAFRIETDLRSIIFRHLSTLSFSFYDRVQSGQLISRANSDIRSLQMFLAFAPLIGLSILSFVLALILML